MKARNSSYGSLSYLTFPSCFVFTHATCSKFLLQFFCLSQVSAPATTATATAATTKVCWAPSTATGLLKDLPRLEGNAERGVGGAGDSQHLREQQD